MLQEILGGIGAGVLALAGVFAGALLGRSNEKSKRLAETLREMIVESLDLAYEFEHAMHTFTIYAPRGHTDPAADTVAAEALSHALEMQHQMRRGQGRISIVGSQELVDAFAIFQSATSEYMDEVARQLNAGGLFKAAPARLFLDKYAEALDEYVTASRKDLGAKGSVTGSHKRQFNAVQVNPPPPPGTSSPTP